MQSFHLLPQEVPNLTTQIQPLPGAGTLLWTQVVYKCAGSPFCTSKIYCLLLPSSRS